jgi:hypothetical protein
MFRTISKNHGTIDSTMSVAAAALIAGLAVLLMPATPKAEVVPLLAQTDRLPVLAKQSPCSLTGWPHYEPSCQFDLRAPSGDIRTVRIIALR